MLLLFIGFMSVILLFWIMVCVCSRFFCVKVLVFFRYFRVILISEISEFVLWNFFLVGVIVVCVFWEYELIFEVMFDWLEDLVNCLRLWVSWLRIMWRYVGWFVVSDWYCKCYCCWLVVFLFRVFYGGVCFFVELWNWFI